MLPDEKREGLLRFLSHGLIANSSRATEKDLGDRSTYIGLSDIGKAIECMRLATADKAGITSSPCADVGEAVGERSVEGQLKRQIILQRGHWQEYGVENALKATGANFVSQLEISTDYKGVLIKAHLDFTIVRNSPHPAVRILELKSNEYIPDHLYASYEAQLYGQIGMLCENWGRPVFTISSDQLGGKVEGLTFPNLAQQCFGVKLPNNPAHVDIEAWVVSVSMSEVKPFGPYRYDRAALQTCYEKAAQIWNNKESLIAGSVALDDIPHAAGFHPLCEYCSVNGDCPKFSSILIHDAQYAHQLTDLAELKEKEKALAKQKRYLETMIKNRYRLAGDIGDNWLSAGDYRFKLSQVPGRKSVDQELLRDKLGEYISESEAANKALSSCMKYGDPYERLYVSRINRQ